MVKPSKFLFTVTYPNSMSSISNYYVDYFGPWALIAGASEGIGAAFAEELASKGINVVLVARSKDILNKLVKKIEKQYSVQVKVIVQDLTSKKMLDEISKKTKNLEIGFLVVNAALSPIGLFHNTTEELHNKVIDLNCRSPMLLSYYFGKEMKTRGKGGIILISSLAGLQGNPIHTHYSATRGYVINLAEGLWDEMKNFGVKVMVCQAGPTKTPNWGRSTPKEPLSVRMIILEPKKVAQQAIRAIKRRRKPYFVPGFLNRMFSFFLQHTTTRKQRVKLMGSVARKMYGEEKNYSNK